MRGQALAWAVPVAGIALVMIELTRLPFADPDRVLAALGELARSALRQFAVPALVFFAAAIVVGARSRLPRRAVLPVLFSLGLAQAALAREALIEHGPFAWSVAATLALALAGIALGAALAWLGSDALERHPRATRLAGAAMAVLSLAGARAHYAFYVGLYPTLHECTLLLCFSGCATGIALVFARAPRAWVVQRAAAFAAVPLALVGLLDLPAAAEARPYVVAYTELGRSAGVARALEREAAFLAPRSLPGPRTDPILAPDDDAERRFAEHSGLPALPEGFALAEHDVLLVLSDATRYDRTSLAREGGPTPSLAALARSALVFERAYAPSNGTFPSVASMLAMTPVSFAELDVQPRFWRGRLRDERTTAVEAMRESGRRTFWIGHDHDGCFSRHIAGLEQGFEARVLVPDEPDADARIASLAVEAIRAHRAAGERYFGLVFFGSPHDEYLARDGDPEASDLERYERELAYMDAQLGRLLAAVDDRTVVIFAGDHGEAFGEHGHRFHLSSMHDEQIRVPFVARVPGVRAARIERPTSTAYLFPWLLSRGTEAERAVVRRALREDVGPLMRALDGAVVSEMIGPRSQEAALVFAEHVVLYDVLADLVRIFDAADAAQLRDLREDRPDLLGHFAPLAERYRRVRFSGRRFRFVPPPRTP